MENVEFAAIFVIHVISMQITVQVVRAHQNLSICSTTTVLLHAHHSISRTTLNPNLILHVLLVLISKLGVITVRMSRVVSHAIGTKGMYC
jgi:uncharacterized membrane protein